MSDSATRRSTARPAPGPRTARLTATARLAGTLLIAALVGGCGYSAYPHGEPATETTAAKKPLIVGGYRAGFLHSADIKSVSVQVFASREFRREIEFRLSEALAKRIVAQTQYGIAKKNEADTILYGEVKAAPQTLPGSDFDSGLPKEIQVVLVVDWTWKNRRTGEVIAQQRSMEQAGDYIPIAGETFFDGSEQAINRLARRIVEGMEADW